MFENGQCRFSDFESPLWRSDSVSIEMPFGRMMRLVTRDVFRKFQIDRVGNFWEIDDYINQPPSPSSSSSPSCSPALSRSVCNAGVWKSAWWVVLENGNGNGNGNTQITGILARTGTGTGIFLESGREREREFQKYVDFFRTGIIFTYTFICLLHAAWHFAVVFRHLGAYLPIS